MKLITSLCLGTALLLTAPAANWAGETKEEIAAIDKQLAPIRKKAMADPEVKAAQEQLKAAQEKYNAAIEAAMKRTDPKAEGLLAERKKLSDEIAAAKKAAAKPAEAKPAKK
jgi:septal ring factor EnvC (AmiA/AmiB activator)